MRSVVDRIERIAKTKPKFYCSNVASRSSLKTIFNENKIDAVIHFAGFKAVGESVEKPLDYYCNNLNTTLTLLHVMKEFGCKK